ncbi:MAG: cell division protein SepF [Clostridia bacterium]|nr:cell division protein SepF [Clostridia bacterium]
MSIKDIKDRLVSRFGNRGPKDFARRPDGGTSCYRPFQKKSTAAEENGMAAERIQYAHTGFTGMNPPSEEGTFSSGPMQNESETPYNAFGGYGAPLTQNAAQGNETGYNYGPKDNISYMPGMQSREGTFSETTVETVNIVTMTSLRSCYDAIASMKNGEILILSMDAIANDGEVTRCQDMLAGAAFTLGCTVRPLAGTRMILVAPASVRILPAERERVQQVWQPQPVYTQPAAAAAADQPRQRRAVQNYDLYGNAAAGMNPYTGRTPVTAGEYSNYGGYGY